MLKKKRLQWILEKVNVKNVITVNGVIKELGASDMTARHDLDELDRDGLLIRIHDGIQSIDNPKIRSKYEKSNTKKQEPQIEEKRTTTKFASRLVQEGEMISVGPGTTLEHFASELIVKNIRVIIDSLPVFNILNEDKNIDLILTSGEYRDTTGAFVGSLAANYLQNLKFSKAFMSANGVFGDSIAAYSESEGKIRRVTLDNAIETLLLVDHEKFGKYNSYDFYRINDINHLVADSAITSDTKEKFGQLADIIVAKD